MSSDIHGRYQRAFKNRYAFWLGLILLMLAAVVLRMRLLNSFPLTFDEGIHLIWLRLLSAGYQPYSEVYITYPPLYPLAIEAVWKIWPTEAAQRWFSVAYTLLGTVGIALLAREFSGNIAGLVAAALTLFSPSLFESSRGILGEFPSIAWSVWAIWLAWLYRDATWGRRIWLILSGLCLAASLLTKFLSPFVVVLILLIIIASQQVVNSHPTSSTASPHFLGIRILRLISPKFLLIDLTLWGLALFLPIIILISIYDVNSFVRPVVGQRLGAYVAYTSIDSLLISGEDAMTFIRDDATLVILALFGITVTWTRRKKDVWIMLAWLALALAMLVFHNPVRHKHYFILIPPLAILGGAAVAQWVSGLRLWLAELKNLESRQRSIASARSAIAEPGFKVISRSSKIAIVGGLILLFGLYSWQIPNVLDQWRIKANEPQPPLDEVEALAFIDEVTAPDDCIITDDVQLLYWSGRMTPPELAEVSDSRLRSGALTLEELVEITDRYDCQLVAPVSNRISKYLPKYMLWIEYRRYLGRFKYGDDHLFFTKVNTDPNPDTSLWANFADQISFLGYTLQSSVTPGERLPLTLIWQAQTHISTNYTIFVQLRDSNNNVLVNADHQPYKGLTPISAWPPGEVIQEMTWLYLPMDIPPGRYNIYVGLYSLDNMERLPLVNDTSGENALILGPVLVQ